MVQYKLRHLQSYIKIYCSVNKSTLLILCITVFKKLLINKHGSVQITSFAKLHKNLLQCKQVNVRKVL